jgi:hypothetical protein
MGTSHAWINTTQINVTLLFDGAKWVALVERHDDEGYAVCEVFCGLSEPMLALVYEMLLATYATLEFTRPHAADAGQVAPSRTLNFKRMQRESRRLLSQADAMVRVRDATREERAQQKAAAAAAAKAERAIQEAEEYQRKQARKKEKQRGR